MNRGRSHYGRFLGGKFIHRNFLLLLLVISLATVASGWEREPNQVFAGRRARLVAAVGAPVVVFGYTGHENANPSYVFMQEENFYYLSGHAEEGAALLLLPESAAQKGWKGAREILYLPARDPAQEKWDGPRMAPDDPGIREKTGFAEVESFDKLRQTLAGLAKDFPEIYTELPGPHAEGYPHAANWSKWMKDAAPQAALKDVSPAAGTLRSVKSAGEMEVLTRAVELSVDAHLEAMKMMRPGLYEYQVAAKMQQVHASGGCETEAYAPIVGSGFNSTVLHYNKLDRRIEDGDIVVLDVGGQYSGYAADVTRTLPASGKFTPRQREIYDIVLGAQNAALAALKPGMTIAGEGPNSLQRIATEYINTHGQDKQGRPLGRYYIHGLSHHLGLNVHDPSGPARPLEAGMVITVEPGIYIPEENIGVRIEDDVLITATGYQMLTARLPRTAGEIEKVMADAKRQRGN